MSTVISVILQILAVAILLFLIWPHIKKEKWKEKFIDNKQARSVLIVFVLVLVLVVGISWSMDALFPLERLD
ncbi:hypothetical protein [Thiomicrospira sp. WB1]|uniref:hypothetical protein n=1 Tax=Thiomicrospira sp. WB1 TaxID=1685380 RepID=UPI00074AD397|nr:hypothetical protein [Thiomicrospira sp. WB1]KUJ72112.1 hypothetical protein AVO41_06675 [Thiomicrospira sp. WB1]